MEIGDRYTVEDNYSRKEIHVRAQLSNGNFLVWMEEHMWGFRTPISGVVEIHAGKEI